MNPIENVDKEKLPYYIIGAGFFIAFILVVGSLVTNAVKSGNTSRMIESVANRLDSDESKSYYIRHESLSEHDAWGNQLKVVYTPSVHLIDETGGLETLTVISSGKDGIFGTPDDMETSRTNGKLKLLGSKTATGIKTFVKETGGQFVHSIFKKEE